MDTIKLIDQDGNACYFQEQALINQLAFSGLPNSASSALKTVVRNFVNAVVQWRMALTRYYSLTHQDQKKQEALAEAKRLEVNVHKMLQFINQTIDRV